LLVYDEQDACKGQSLLPLSSEPLKNGHIGPFSKAAVTRRIPKASPLQKLCGINHLGGS
jgi:hypothetical protein